MTLVTNTNSYYGRQNTSLTHQLMTYSSEPDFSLENVGKRVLIRCALYGGKSAGDNFCNHLCECMAHLGFCSCLADPDVWMGPAMKANGNEYWEYVLLYVDNALVLSDNAKSVLCNKIGKYFELKEASISPPTIYLGGKMHKVVMQNGMNAWAFSLLQYVQAAVKNVEDNLAKSSSKLPTKCNTPIASNYQLETDTSKELCASNASTFQLFIGIICWIVELGRVDICCEVSMLSSYIALPRRGHLQQLYHIFSYLKKYHNAEMVFDLSDPILDYSLFDQQDWTSTEFGLSLQEVLPGNMPQAHGLSFIMCAFVDANHASDSISHHSHTGYIIYLDMAPIYWLLKKQTGVETSSFGSEFIAMKQCTEYVCGLHYKLHMMDIPCTTPAFIFGDNQLVLANTSIPDSTLKKKSQSIAYHFVCEGCACDEWRTAYMNMKDNPADLVTKPLPSGEKRMGFVRMVLHHIFGGME